MLSNLKKHPSTYVILLLASPKLILFFCSFFPIFNINYNLIFAVPILLAIFLHWILFILPLKLFLSIFSLSSTAFISGYSEALIQSFSLLGWLVIIIFWLIICVILESAHHFFFVKEPIVK